MSRRLRLALLTAGAGLAAAAVAVLLLAVLWRPELRLRADLTRTGSAGVSERTAAALRALPAGSVLTAFLFAENPAWLWNGAAVYPRAFDRLRSVLDDARLRSDGHLEVVVLDAASPLVAVEEARQRLARGPGDTLVLETGGPGGARRVLPFAELFQVAEPTRDGTPARLYSERLDHALGSAALGLAQGRQPRAAVLVAGRPDALRDPEALAPLARLLANEGFDPFPVTRFAEAGDAALLVVPGQQQPLTPADAGDARAWLDAGRPLLLALGAFAPAPAVAFWNDALASRGIHFGDGLVCEPVRTAGGRLEGDAQCGNLETAGPEFDDQHPITMRLAVSGRAALFAAARPVEAAGGGNNDWTRARLARTSPEAWVDEPAGTAFTQDPDERRGIRGLAVAAEPWTPRADGASGRIIALGTAASLEGGRLAYAQDFVAASLRWLAGREMKDFELVATRELPFRPAQSAQARLDNLAVLGLPGVAFLLAGWIAWRRRR